MLKYVLDSMAHVDTKDYLVKGVMDTGGEMAQILGTIMTEAHLAGRVIPAPWEKKNLHKYLVDEDAEAIIPKPPKMKKKTLG